MLLLQLDISLQSGTNGRSEHKVGEEGEGIEIVFMARCSL